MFYLVSGFPRSGTSMLMRSLEAGGLPPKTSEVRNGFASRVSDESYQLNPGRDLYELTAQELALPWTYQDGVVIKVVAPLVSRIPKLPQETRVVFMWRNAEEVRQSYNAMMEPARNRRGQPQIRETTAADVEAVQRWAVRFLREHYQVIEFEYREVLTNPLPHFQILARNGWPIDAEKSAAVPDPSYQRFKAENITEGL